MRLRGLVLLLLGLMLAIGQPIHALYYSGHSIARVDLVPTPQSSLPPQGPPFALDPSMSPVRIMLNAEIAGPPHMSARFDAVLLRDGFEAWRGPVLFAVRRDGGRHDVSAVVHTLDLDAPATWTVALVRTGGRIVNVTDVRVELRRNVSSPSVAIVVVGVALALAGGLLFAGDLRAARELRNAWRSAPHEIA